MYVIEVLEPSGRWWERARVATNPEAVAEGFRRKKIRIEADKPYSVPKYKDVRVRALPS